jgi:large subunit ribosomal protein L1
MAKHGKKYRDIKAKVPTGALDMTAAIDFLKANRIGKFDETVELSLRMGIDPKKSDNTIRGSVSLPHGSGRSLRVLVFASGSAADAARAAGADFVGADDMVEKVKEGWTGLDVAIATPDAMKEVRKLGKGLGPRGLMPNPETGTVTDDTADAVRQAKAGKVEFRMDRHGNINVPVGKVSFDTGKLVENGQAVVSAVKAEKPAGAKGEYIRNCSVTTTMGVGVKVNVRD